MNMIFSNNHHRRNNSDQPNLSNFMRFNRNPSHNNNIRITTPSAPIIDNKPKMKWGAPTWMYLHTMAEKVFVQSFPQIKNDLLRIIYNICTNVPCPFCSSHAKEYLNKHSLLNVRTKEELKQFLYLFHNEVNERKGYPKFAFTDLTNTYENGNYKQIVNHFMHFFQEKTRNIHLIADEMYRQRVVKTIRQWIIDNLNHFEIE